MNTLVATIVVTASCLVVAVQGQGLVCPDIVNCPRGYRSKVHQQSGQVYCEPSCEIDNGGCPADKICSLKSVQCALCLPCPPTVECSDPDPCSLPADPGTCDCFAPSYFWNSTSKRCELFAYSGCGGNLNRFPDLSSCSQKCGPACPPGMVYKECGPNCPETCDNYYDCQIIGPCSSGCFCPDDKVLSGNGTCINRIDCPGCETGIDLVIVLDVSYSIHKRKAVQPLLRFTRRIIQRLDIGLDSNLVGIVLFANDSRFHFGLQQHTSRRALLSAIDALSRDYPNRRQTYFVPLFNLLSETKDNSSFGFRPEYPDVAIIVTDGRPTDKPPEAFTLALDNFHRQDIYQLYAVGVGKANLMELARITKDRSTAFFANSLDDATLAEVARRLTERLCSRNCPIEGQIKKTYALPLVCQARCFNTDELCPAAVIPDGCECPDGMVIHDLDNKCVLPEECPVCPFDGQIRKRYPTYSCDRYCDDPEDKVCGPDGREYECECPDGMIINKATNRCVHPRDCPDPVPSTTTVPTTPPSLVPITSILPTTTSSPSPAPTTSVSSTTTAPSTFSSRAVPTTLVPSTTPVPTPSPSPRMFNDCSIEGQIRKTYTSHHFCHARCFHTDDICPLLVIMDECECPDGMVIHDLKNKCVLPEECPVCPIDGQIRRKHPVHICDRYCDDPEDKICGPVDREYVCECPDEMIINKAMNKCVHPRDCPDTCKIKGYDLVIAIDESRSVDETEFKKILNFATRIIEELDIGEDHTKVGVILFDKEARVHFDLNQYTNKSSLLSAINQIEHNPVKGNNYSIVLQQLHELSQDTSKGFRDGFDDIAVILTDAKNVQDSDIKQLPTKLNSTTNYELYAVGIALEDRSSDQQLKDLALLTGDESHVFIADSVTDEQLDQIGDNLTVLLCERRLIPTSSVSSTTTSSPSPVPTTSMSPSTTAPSPSSSRALPTTSVSSTTPVPTSSSSPIPTTSISSTPPVPTPSPSPICPVIGQIIKQYVSHPNCHERCFETEIRLCPQILLENGCICPDGMAIDEATNECVLRSDCPGCRIEGLDTIIALDVSFSITSHNLAQSVLKFTKRVVKRLDISLRTNLIGLVQFGFDASFVFPLQRYTSTRDVLSALDEFGKMYPRHNKTNFVPLLEFLGTSANDQSLGFRPNYSNVAVVITDGRSTDTSNLSSAAMALHNRGVYQRYAVGVGNANLNELEVITDDEKTAFFESQLNDETIRQLERQLFKHLCQNRKCPAGMVFKECGSNCPVTCDNYDNYDCQVVGCHRGCFCPYNKVLSSNGTCIDVYDCLDDPTPTPPSSECLHEGIVYEEGQTFRPNCSTVCICENERFNCAFEETECGSTCIIHGDPHYNTFDQYKYDFMGLCEYVLSEPCDANDFVIVGKNTEVKGNKAITATEVVRVIIPSQDLEIDLTRGRGGQVYINGVLQPNDGDGVLYSSVGVQVVRSGGHPTVFLTMRFPVKIHWDGSRRVRITASKEWQGQLCGLCGNYNNDHSDDLVLTNGSLTTSVNDFGNSWLFAKTEEKCLHDPITCPPDIRPIAESKCNVIATVFGACYSVVNRDDFFEDCVYDYCATGRDEEYFCDAVSTYAEQCASEGVVIPNWRTPSFCPISCPPGKVYQQCGPSCPQTCDIVNGDDTCIGGGCASGCFCPSGMVQAQNGTCISESSCSVSCTIKGYDLVIAIDDSVSVNKDGFEKIIRFTKEMIEDLDIGEDHTKVGVIKFAEEATECFDLNKYTNKADLLSAINQIPYTGEKGTVFSNVLQQLRQLSQNTSKGFRNDFDDIAIIVTDGRIRNRGRKMEEKKIEMELNIHNYELYAVGISDGRSADKQHRDLAFITGDESHVLIANEVTDDELDQIRGNLTAQLCERRLIVVNFTAGSYDVNVGETNAIVRVQAHGKFSTPFLVNVVVEGGFHLSDPSEIFFIEETREVLFPATINNALVPIRVFPDALRRSGMAGRFNVRLEVNDPSTNHVIIGSPSQAVVTVPAPIVE